MKNILIYVFTFILIVIVVSNFVTEEQINLLKEISNFEISVSITIALAIFSVSGFQFSYILKRTTGVRLSIIDRITFPISRNLWSYLVPFQGSLAYSLVFNKFKYKVKLIDGFSINLYIILFNFFFTGIIGLYYSLNLEKRSFLIFILSFLFAASPLLLILTNIIINKIKIPEKIIFKFLFLNIQKAATSISNLFKDLNFTINIFIFNIIHTLITTLWFYWTVWIFKLNIDFISVILLALILKTSLIFRLTPGNVGIEQLLFGGIFFLIGYDPKTGVLISLFHKSITIFLSFSIGVLFTLLNFKYFSLNKILDSIKKVNFKAFE
jgi:hypothetical protein